MLVIANTLMTYIDNSDSKHINDLVISYSTRFDALAIDDDGDDDDDDDDDDDGSNGSGSEW